jgi:hypothetical protein
LILAERLLAIHHAFDEGGIDHAFGGAIALAYWTLEPRGTRDIDVNVFSSPDEAELALEALPDEISRDDAALKAIQRDAQARLWWEETPVDLFFSNLPIHHQAALHRREVPFEGERIPILASLELALFKAMFDRTRDWADIEEMLRAHAFDPEELRRLIVEHVGRGDARLGRLENALREVEKPSRTTGRDRLPEA